jgi:D-alanine-D-alanine ligase
MNDQDQDQGQSLRVAVLAGGRSSEHDVSLSSAAAVTEGLEQAGHVTRLVQIDRDGVWRLDGNGNGDGGAAPDAPALQLAPGRGLLDADVVFPALHGPYGEDGTVQGLLDTLDVPFVGAGVQASAVCIDKVLFKGLMAAAGVPQVGHLGVPAERFANERESVLDELAGLGLPVFVKPARLGSSVGIVKVTDAARLADALAHAFVYDELAIVEAASAGLEVECGVLGELGAPRSAALASEPGEIGFSTDRDTDFYDYEAKYEPGGMELIVPARISSHARERVRELAVETFAAVGCDGLARVDFFVEGEQVLVNELNTMPGFTPTSVYAKLLDASGVPYPAVVDRLCRLALERHAERGRYRN